MKKVVQKIIAAGVVKNGDKILVIQRASDDDAFAGLWEIPSGKREELEKTADAVRREVFEETGLDVEVGDPVGVFDFQVDKPDEIRDAIQISFLAIPKGPTEVKLSHEHQKFAWITEKELDKYNLTSEMKKVLQKAFNS